MITWVRSAVYGKKLDEILASFDKLHAELEEFDNRTQERMQQELEQIKLLQDRYDRRADEIEKARLVRTNIQTMMTQHLVTQQPEENNECSD